MSTSRKRYIHLRWYQFRNRYSIMTYEMIERTKEERFITTPHVWYRPSDLQKRARFFFPKMQIIPRLAGYSRCRARINWEEWTGDGDDIQIRARRKWRKYTYDTHPSYITRNWLVFRYRGIEFRLHPAGRRAFACVSQKTSVSIIQIFVIMSHNLEMTSLLVWQTIGWLPTGDFAKWTLTKMAICSLDCRLLWIFVSVCQVYPQIKCK